MRLEPGFLLLLSLALMAGGLRAEDQGIAAGGKRSCVPNADRTGWECADAPINPAPDMAAEPAAAAAPEATEEPPPAMLAAPDEGVAPLSDFYRIVPDTEPQADPLPETVLSEPQAMAQEQIAEPAPEPEPEPEPVVAAAPEPMPEAAPEAAPIPEPEPLPEPVAVVEPVPVSPVAGLPNRFRSP
ncbi:MAG: hypothetical protein IPK97_03890 [Ahniella sp.]|nr:hypothetical protein [Ahniella sp.]